MIYTTANHVKRAGVWCEDADRQTQEALDKDGKQWDSPLSIEWGIEHLGLANTLLALNPAAVIPKYKKRAEIALDKYWLSIIQFGTETQELYAYPKEQVTSVERALIMFDSRPSGARNMRRFWESEKELQTDAGVYNLADAMLIMFSNNTKHIKCIHAGKFLLAADYARTHNNNMYKAMCRSLIECCQ